MEERALTVRGTDLSLADTMTLGKVLAESGFFQDSRQASQAVVKVLAGRELGFGPIASMTGINIIQGRVAITANLMAAAVKRSGRYNYKVLKLDDSVCELEFFEQGKHAGVSLFDMDDARKAGTKNTDKFPRNMLFARAMSNGVKWYCPDLTNGPACTPEELGAVVDGETGEVIDGGPRWTEPIVKAGEEAAKPEPDLDDVFPRNDPPAQPKPKPTAPKVAVKTGKWNAAAAKLAGEQSYYQTDGQPNFYKMLGCAAKHAGVTEITDANLPDVIAALTAHAIAEMTPRPGDVTEPDGLEVS